MNTLRTENNATALLTKFAQFVASFSAAETKTEKEVETKGHSFLDQATRLGCDMSHFNHIS